MSNTLMGTLQQAIRNTFGCANDFNGDLHVLCDYWGIPMVPISGRTIDVSRKYDASITDATSALNYLLYNPEIAVPGLALNFVSTNETLDPRITFSRTSNATQFDSAGNLVYAPHNLLTFSEQFDNSAWSKSSATITANAAIAPVGSTTAEKLISDSGSSLGNVLRDVAYTAGTPFTLSVYAKAGEWSYLFINMRGLDASSDTAGVWFNLANGTVGTQSTGYTGTITSVGDGWYRCAATRTVGSGASASRQRFFATNGDNALTAGDGTSGIFVWGAQLNVGALQPYYPTTVKNLLGYSQEFDNAAWTKANSFVQTNLLLQSETFDNATWGKSNVTITANTTASPNGAITGDTLLTTAAGGAMNQTSQSFAAGSTVTVSVYAKKNASNFLRIELGNLVNCWFNLNTGVAGANDAGSGNVLFSAKSIQDAGNGWYRCVLTVTTTTITTLGVLLFATDANNASSSINSSVFLWGAQLVQGSTAGDYQRTDATTRAVMYPAPDGSVTADKLVEDTATGEHSAGQTFSFTTGALYTASVYVKAGERTSCRFGAGNTGVWAAGVVFNLSTGTITSSPAGSGSIVNVGNGWYRISVTGTAATTASTSVVVRLVSTGSTISYTGDGTSGIFIWGAQLSDSASLDPYVYNPAAAFTSTAYYGPRFDYDPVTLAPRGLLIEEQRTNSIRNNSMVGAVAGTPGTLPTNWAVSGLGTLTQTVVGTGTSNGINYIDIRFNGTTSTTSVSIRLEPSGTSGIAATNGQTWAFSAWTAVVAGSTANITQAGLSTNIFDSGGAFLAGIPYVNFFFNTTSTLTRVAPVGTIATVGTAFISPQMYLTFASGAAIDITLRIGLPQLELGAFATSVIPTTTAAATRTADVATMVGANFSNWYRQDEGTLFVEHTQPQSIPAGAFPSTATVSDGTNSNRLIFFNYQSGGNRNNFTGTVSGVAQWNMDSASTIVTVNAATKAAGAYKLNDIGLSVNAISPLTDTSATLPTVNAIYIGNSNGNANFLNGYIRRIAYYPTRLSNAQLQAVTA